MIVTVGAPDLPPAWLDQLTADGRLVVPLQVRGQQRSIAFERADGYWRQRQCCQVVEKYTILRP